MYLIFFISDQGLDPVKMIEPPLRVQVLIAQSQAGLWRRNGYALLNQVQCKNGQHLHGISDFSTCILMFAEVFVFNCEMVTILLSSNVSVQNFFYFKWIKLRLIEFRYCHLFLYFQIYFYHNVKCRQEMYDKDILMLQVC